MSKERFAKPGSVMFPRPSENSNKPRFPDLDRLKSTSPRCVSIVTPTFQSKENWSVIVVITLRGRRATPVELST